MSKTAELFSYFIKVFHFFGLWSTPVLGKWHFRILLVAYSVLEIICFLLIAGSFFDVESFEEFVVSLMYTAGYCWMISCDVNFLNKQPEIEKFMEKLCEVFYENQESLLFVDLACINARKIMKFMAYLETFALNFGIILIPLIYGVLLLPMWKLSDIGGSVEFAMCSLLQILSINFVIIHISAVIILWYCFIILINGYAQFLSFKLRILIATKDIDGRQDMIECIGIHLKLKR